MVHLPLFYLLIDPILMWEYALMMLGEELPWLPDIFSTGSQRFQIYSGFSSKMDGL